MAKKSTSIATIEQLQKQAINEAAEADLREESGGGTFLKASKGEFSICDEVLSEELSVIILDYSHEQALYPGTYDPKKPPEQPTCFAVAYTKDELKPHEESPHPEADNCADCDLNEWDGDNPPDCSQRRRLALIDVSSEGHEILLLNLSPGAIKAWRNYPSQVHKKTRMKVHNVVTTLSWNHDNKDSYGNPKLQFTLEDVISDPALFVKATALREEAMEKLLAPIRITERGEQPATKKGKKKKARAERKPAPKPAKATPKKGKRRY